MELILMINNTLNLSGNEEEILEYSIERPSHESQQVILG